MNDICFIDDPLLLYRYQVLLDSEPDSVTKYSGRMHPDRQLACRFDYGDTRSVSL